MNKGFLVAIALMTLLACGGGGGGNSSSGSSTPTPPVTPTAPQIVTQPSSATVQAGSTVVFLVATNVTDATYQWFKNSAAISGGTSATYSFTAALTDNGDTFYVNVTNAAGTVTSSVATLTVTSIPPVQTAPVITAEPSSTTVTVGSAATFSVTATA